MRFIFLAWLLLNSLMNFACDICGGVSSNASIGLFASTKFHTIGYKSSIRSFTSYLYGVRHSQEYLFTQELQFRTQLHPRIQLIGSLPFQNAVQLRDLGRDAVYGIGDANLLGNFVLYQNRDSLGMSKNFLSVGLGLKFPLGKNVPSSNVLKNLYPGTGSWDYLLLANYTKQFSSKWGWQTEASYSLKGTDKYNFRYGNTTQIAAQGFTNRGVGSYRLIIATGLTFENHQTSRANGAIDSSITNAGYILSAKASVNLLTYRWLWSFNVQHPIKQNINSSTIFQNLSAGLTLNYLIKNSKNEKVTL